MKFSSRLLRRSMLRVLSLMLVLPLVIAISSCGKEDKEKPFDTNLLENSSFEEVKGGIPKHWTVTDFKGVEGQQESRYGIDNTEATDGQNSWFFMGDPGTRKFYALTQEVEIPDTRYLRVRGWVKTVDIRRDADQYHQANYLLTFYDENHERFEAFRTWDKRTKYQRGTNPWTEVDDVFRVPKRTSYVDVSCILGCDGKIWFDNVELIATQPVDWQTQRTKNFVFYWLPERPFPAGSIETEQRLFDYFAGRLGLDSDVVVDYYLYPDTSTFRNITKSKKGHQLVIYVDQEIHTINPNENHEIVHMITDAYGKAPRSIAEGTVFWLQDDWKGKPVDVQAAGHLANGSLPTIKQLTNYDEFNFISTNESIPAAASFIGFIVDRWGAKRLLELYRTVPAFDSYDTFARVFEQVYGVPCADAEEQWRQALAEGKTRESSEPESQ
jgi:hypothetical protein